jgi:hypothetical protein
MWYFGRSGEPTFVDKAPNASGFARSTATLLMRGYVWGAAHPLGASDH